MPSRRSPSACYIPLLLPRFDSRATRDKASTPIMEITDRPLTRGMRRELEKAGATPSALPQLHAVPAACPASGTLQQPLRHGALMSCIPSHLLSAGRAQLARECSDL